MIKTIVIAGLLLACNAMPAFAEEAAAPLKATTKDTFAGVVVDLHKEMQEGGRYAYVTERERTDVEANLERMRVLFDKAPSTDAMGKDDKVALFNAQEAVNAVLEKRDRDRVICERSAVTGSRISTTQCRTYGQIEAEREASQKLMRDKPGKNGCVPPVCS